MANSQIQKHFLRRFFASKAFIIVGAVLLVFFTVAYIRAAYQNYQIREEIRRLQSEATQLQSKKFATLELLKYAKSPAYVEEKARTELNLVKDGEQVTIIDRDDPTKASRQVADDMLKSDKSISNPRLWWNYFFNH
jgi:cell division protein FtsB